MKKDSKRSDGLHLFVGRNASRVTRAAIAGTQCSVQSTPYGVHGEVIYVGITQTDELGTEFWTLGTRQASPPVRSLTRTHPS